MAQNGTDSDSSSRRRIAFGILIASIVGVVATAIAAIAWAGDNRGEVTREVFTAVLPLFGTWVGTVLAFYFARDNFEAATQSTALLTGIQTTPQTVDAVMIKRQQILAYELAPTDSLDDVPLSDLHAKIGATNWERLPVFVVDPAQKTSVVAAVVTKRVLTTYAAEQSGALPDVLVGKTVKDLSADCRSQLDLWDAVAPQAAVAEARTKMAGPPQLTDVFVTENGAKDGNVVGWLTNSLLAAVHG